MLRYLIVIVFVLVCDTQAKICDSVRAVNKPENLEQLRNCHVIAGYLEIFLFDAVENESEYYNKTFPELVEVTEFVIMYNVHKLKSLNQLFPNLRTIRGVSLFGEYSLVIYDNPDIEEIGLSNLMYIARGKVKVEKNPRICYVDSIDWKAIGTQVDTNSRSSVCVNSCDKKCHNYCWNRKTCQIRSENCHSECVGCNQPESAKHCKVCRNFNDTGECVQKCPKNKYANKYFYTCVLKEECTGEWFIFDEECVTKCPPNYERDNNLGCKPCGEYCIKTCDPIAVDNESSLEKLTGCTHISGSLDIRITKPEQMSILESSLGSIREINGTLTVGRSSLIHNLKFFKNLHLITGVQMHGKNALYIYENDELDELWDFDKLNLTIKSGGLGIFNNPLLCLSHIEKLAEKTGVKFDENKDIVSITNGYLANCTGTDLQIKLSNVSSTNVTFTWQPYGNLTENETIIGYAIYYNVKNFYDDDSTDYRVCGSDGWESVYASNYTNFTLTKLQPYTTYSYYFKVYLGNSGSMDFRGKHINRQISTMIQFFNTSASDPSEVRQFTAIPLSSETIELRWVESAILNGILSKYRLSIYKLIDQIDVIRQRDYCRFPITENTKPIIEPKPNELINTTLPMSTNENDCCLSEEKTTKIRLLNLDHLTFCDIRNNEILEENNEACFKNVYYLDKESADDDFIVQSDNMVKEAYLQNRIIERLPDIIIHDTSKTTYILKNLEQYTLYYFVISVCNEPTNDNDNTLCSSVSGAFTRTLKNEHADDITNLDCKPEENNYVCRWEEPRNPNSILVSYSIDIKREDRDYSHDCITREHFLEKRMYTIQNPLPGKHSVSVRATSIAGPGHFSEPIIFFVPDPSTSKMWFIIVLFFILFLIAAVVFYLVYKKKLSVDNVHLITSVNPDYAMQYIEDELEVDRNDVEILSELGQGTFGMVYSGRIISKNLACALKTVNETATLTERMKFLNEASVMKSFHKAHHVVKLLGVVSKGQPPLVIMELMERGDLKQFLRRSRDSSQNITSNEMYRMAAEIADGMAYLVMKKFVHRDLAARNCMVAHDHTVKIGDFGMARDIYETDYYRKETKGLLPVRWMAPESLADGVFTSDSDVWSYGVVLWEMATLAEQPYQGLGNEEVLQFVISKGTLQRPPNCPDMLYEIMSACWKWRPIDRPLFTDILSELEDHVGEDFKLKSFYHNTEGEDWRVAFKERVNNPPAMGLANAYTRYNAYNENVNLLIDGHGSDSLLQYPSQRRSQLSLSNHYLGQSSSPSKYSDNSLDSS